MKIYIDIILLINFGFDFLLLLSVNLLLKRRKRLLRILLGSLLGSLSIFFLFIKMSSFTLFLLKVGTSILMVLATFGKKGFLKNMLSLYTTSILLGGFLYFINLQFSYKNEGLVFFYNGFHLNLLLLLILSPIILYIHYKESRYFKESLKSIYTVEMIKDGKSKIYRAYLDTGNQLYDPYKNRPVTILYDPKWYQEQESFLPIPFESVAGTGYLKGIQIDKMTIDQKITRENVLVALTKNPFQLEDANIILHSSMQEELFK